MIAVSEEVTTFEKIVEGITIIGTGAREYAHAIKISLKLPSPSKRVVRHQLPTTQRKKGASTAANCTKIDEYTPSGFMIDPWPID